MIKPSLCFAPLALLLTAPAFSAEVAGDAKTLTANDLPKEALYWRIRGPNTLTLESESSKIRGKGFPDGQYQFQVIGFGKKVVPRTFIKKRLNNGRGDIKSSRYEAVTVLESGYFNIVKGKVVDKKVKEPAGKKKKDRKADATGGAK